ncbi:MAG: hypothetical protein TE42_03345 [Candidatus Synechococcus spongiarum SP3]|uniref:Uncharacterized protein n=1 Tax=Candidatus Synechococcus spongiarum SP3 TaxID=1604020 RepID=A0A0G2HLY3_9SYNE|nr:MAG: hypothetical protein TE42_03345 [Candidatus Synechococcus spongiarum SP3]
MALLAALLLASEGAVAAPGPAAASWILQVGSHSFDVDNEEGKPAFIPGLPTCIGSLDWSRS